MTLRTIVILCAVTALPSFAQRPDFIGDAPDGTRSAPVHLIRIYDEEGHLIAPGDTLAMPYSPRVTCGKCHNYERIRHGWHFSAADSGAATGRRGEPWILVDRGAAVQVPLSYRPWKGTFQPEQFGLSTLSFLKMFGRHLPGGGIGEMENKRGLDDYMRWQVSGNLDVNCQSCHNADPAGHPAEYGVQVLRQNFRWAATASSGFATVQGSAGEMPDNFDMYTSVPPERSDKVPPNVHYNASRFDAGGKVLFQSVRTIPPSQCYFCHSSKVIDHAVAERWQKDEDVHVAAGMICVDCHRNGLDHHMVRGYEGEGTESDRGANATLTCKGCHLGNGQDVLPSVGRRRAPRPEHKGIPPVHFDKLSCTTCHAGSWPGDRTTLVKTSRAHALGIPKTVRDDDALPHINTPVYMKEGDGKYAPANLLWPSFWAWQTADSLTPVLPDRVRPIIGALFANDTTRTPGRWPVLTSDDVASILRSLARLDSAAGSPIYISGGRVYKMSAEGFLLSRSSDAAQPYLWPVGHDVRPKDQALGVRGCDDCHAAGGPFFAGTVHSASPFFAGDDTTTAMTAFQEQSPLYPWILSSSFYFRPALKFLIILAFVIIAAVVVLYAVRGLGYVVRTLGKVGDR
jgi:hypothetical protein